MNKILIATTNIGKVKEIKTLLKSHDFFTSFEFLSLIDIENEIGKIDEPKEDGLSFEENAKIKALYYSKKTGMNVITDDSGFCVEEINNQPSIFSARWAENGSFYPAFDRIYKMLSKINKNTSNAFFVSALCMIIDNKVFESQGIINGRLSAKPLGSNGFGYDPIFIPNGYNKTFAEMEYNEKIEIDHRKIAFVNLINAIRNYNDE